MTMTPNEKLLTDFYTAFQSKDYETMQKCYADTAIFNDAIFTNLNTGQAKAMWQMLIERGKDLQIEYMNIKADTSMGSAEWIATYTFSASSRKVVNHIHSNFRFDSGKIADHTDHFDFYTWARQAFGAKGVLLGWTSFFKRQVQTQAKNSLLKYMQRF